MGIGAVIQELTDIVNESYLIKEENGLLKITETAKDAISTEVQLCKSGQAFVMKLDVSGADPYPFLKEIKDLKLKNDGIVITHNNKKIFVLLVELKSKKVKARAISQLKMGELFTKFLLGIVKERNSSLGTYTESAEFRGIIFSQSRKIPLSRTTKRNSISYDLINNLKVANLKSNAKYNIKDLIS